QLVADVETDWTNRRQVPESRPYRVPQVVQVVLPVAGPHVAAVDEQDGAQASMQRQPRFRAEREHAVSADRRAFSAERADFVPSPAADARGAAEEILFRKRNFARVVALRIDGSHLNAIGDDEPLANRDVMTRIDRE